MGIWKSSSEYYDIDYITLSAHVVGEGAAICSSQDRFIIVLYQMDTIYFYHTNSGTL